MRTMKRDTEMSEREKCAYAAGLIDGEGYISIYQQKQVRTGNSYYRMKVMIAMCETEGVRFLNYTWGGRVYKITNNHAPGGEKNRPLLRWYVCAELATKFLSDVLPFLKVKRPHAELAIAFQSHVKQNRGWQHHSRVMPEDARILRHAMFLRMAELNKRGM